MKDFEVMITGILTYRNDLTVKPNNFLPLQITVLKIQVDSTRTENKKRQSSFVDSLLYKI